MELLKMDTILQLLKRLILGITVMIIKFNETNLNQEINDAYILFINFNTHIK